MKSKIAEGGYSFVYLVEDITTLEPFALKRCIASDSHARKLIEQEIRLLETIATGRNANIVRYLGSMHRENRGAREYLILMEFCAGGSVITEMQQAMNAGQRFSEEKIFKIFVSAMRALQVLHTMNPPYAHRDIKIENILIGNDKSYKLCDFGSCTNQAKLCQSSSEIVAEQEVIERHSTMMYRAPEMCDLYRARSKQWTLNEKVDIWAMGCVMYTLIYFKHPFEDGGVLGILSGKLEFPSGPLRNYSPFPAYIASRCFTVDPSLRPSAADILNLCTEWQHYLKNKTYNDVTLKATLESFVPGIITGSDPTVTSNTAAALAAAAAEGSSPSSAASPNSTKPAPSRPPKSAPTVPAKPAPTSNSVPAATPSSVGVRPAVNVVSAIAVADDFDVDWDDKPQQSAAAAPVDPFAQPPQPANPRARVQVGATTVIAPPATNVAFEISFGDDDWTKTKQPQGSNSGEDWGNFVASSGGDIFGLTLQTESKMPDMPRASSVSPTSDPPRSGGSSTPVAGSGGIDVFATLSASSHSQAADRVANRTKQYASADLSMFGVSSNSNASAASSPMPTAPKPTLDLDAIKSPLELLGISKSRSPSNQSQTSSSTIDAINAMYAASTKPPEQPNYI